MSTEAELKKLTVAQLKTLCKEKKITGYSKLAKDVLIQKLLGTASAPTATPASDTISSDSSESQVPPTQTAPTASPSRPPIQNPQSFKNPAESGSKPRPKKRKNPPASHESPAASTSTDVFKVPAIPQRLVQDPALPPVIPASSVSASANLPKKKKVTADPPTLNPAAPDTAPPSTIFTSASSAPPKKKKVNTDPPTINTAAPDTNPPSTSASSSAPSKKKKVTADSPTLNPAAPPDTTPPPTASASKKRNNVDDPSTASISAASKKPWKSTAEAATNAAVDNAITPSTTAAPKKKKKTTMITPTVSIPSSTATEVADTVPARVQTTSMPNIGETGVLIPPKEKPAAQLPNPSPTVLKRPSILTPTDPPPAKKQKVALLPSSKPHVTSKFVFPRTTTPATSAIVQPPVLTYDTVKRPQVPPKVAQKRFVPLVVRANKSPVPTFAVAPPPSSGTVPTVAKSSIVETLYHLDLPTSPPPFSLSTITLPPSLSQRKRVPRFSLLLSFVAEEDLRNCVLVSRMFRYAVYLSAFHRLARIFAGKRLSAMLVKYPQAMTNMWPYLKQRMQELSARKQTYTSSFLGRLFPSSTTNPISEHLWTSPDHERQIVIALRFLLTRLFFQVSVGGGKDGKGWTEGQIVDAQQLVQDEVWTITVRHSAASTESFYVLESTCEVLTATTDSASPGLPVRADWAAYIAHRASVHGLPAPRLLDYLSWTNHEEYLLGISRLWLKRIEGEGETGVAKRITAERYIFACVVGNSLSGRWMSSMQMAQDFAGLPEGVPARVKASPKVNLFLPAHHHVESLHFTAPMRAGLRRALHSALAVVQTPGREYFILRDNGMQVGCEEDGVAEVWMKILGCDNSGVASRRT
ncbi:hypothetical protein B0H17DRAFT_1054693 [Mycena rosella]|uniref:Rho termination factor N-terminal domain-containing protein n=1 Tax=Mycena rosella TaxID=1033263 RepID=A0AAD7GI39_MYCRO|nr:hypothetical protein B0H17DRAFT_1054693 [Mycena rosella]